jgi:hypothetical protein
MSYFKRLFNEIQSTGSEILILAATLCITGEDKKQNPCENHYPINSIGACHQSRKEIA